MKKNVTFCTIAVLLFSTPVFTRKDQNNNNWYSKEGIWDIAYLDTSYCLFHSFEEEKGIPEAPLALYHTQKIDTVQSFRFYVLASKYKGKLSFGMSLRSRWGRCDIILKGSDSINTIATYIRQKNDSIICTDKVLLTRPYKLDSLSWCAISFVFDDKLIQVSIDGTFIGKIPRPVGFNRKILYGIATSRGIIYFRNIQIKSMSSTQNAVIKGARILLPYLQKAMGDDGIFMLK